MWMVGGDAMSSHTSIPLLEIVVVECDTPCAHHSFMYAFTVTPSADSPTGTAWNSGSNSIVIPPYDKDNNPSSFSTSELNDVVAVWRGVAEDYAPYDIDVTTIPQLGYNPQLYMRVMIGGDGAWFGSAGGVAYVVSHSFGSSTTLCVVE